MRARSSARYPSPRRGAKHYFSGSTENFSCSAGHHRARTRHFCRRQGVEQSQKQAIPAAPPPCTQITASLRCPSFLHEEQAMPRRLPPLTALKAFEAAARHVSFTRAAAELCVTQGAV